MTTRGALGFCRQTTPHTTNPLAHKPPAFRGLPHKHQPTPHKVDLRELRKIAVVKGLGTNALRARAWPLLLGARAGADDLDVLQRLSSSSSSSSSSLHRDSAVVDVDVERSLWAFTRGWSEGARAAARAALRRVINASVAEASRELLEREGGGGGGGAQEKEEGGGGVAGERIGEEASASASASAASAPSLQQRRRRKGEEAPSNGNGNGNGTSSSTLPPSSPSSPSVSPPSSAAAVHYYQGLHDVASVLLLVTGSEVAAFRLLRRLAGCQLRDFTRPTLDAALEACELLPRIVARADPQLGRALDPSRNPGAPPSHYALPWLLTWFAHSASSSLGVVAAARGGNGGGGGKGGGSGENTAAEDAASNGDTLNSAARLFDLFAASHPFMPLYVAAAAIGADRRRLLEALAEGDPAEAHAALAKIRVFGVGERRVGELAAEAARLCRRHPPGELAREAQRQSRAAASARSSTAALARLGEDGSWVVEDRISSGEKGSGKGSGKGGRSKRFGKDGVSNGLFLLKQQLRSEQRARGVAAVALAAGVAALALFAGGPASIGGGGGGGGRG